MSFFSSLQQYVSSGVASLNLSPKRFSLGREDSTSGPPSVGMEEQSISTGPGGSFRRKTLPVTPNSGQHGQYQQQLCQLPVSPMGGGVSPQRGSIASSCGELVVPPGRRSRQSWADIEQATTTGAEEAADASFFESFTALPWKQENRRLIAVKEGEGGGGSLTGSGGEGGSGGGSEGEGDGDGEGEEWGGDGGEGDEEEGWDGGTNGADGGEGLGPEAWAAGEWKLGRKEQLEQLYVELLYTITNKVGAPTGQFSHYKEELYSYAQEAFGLPDDLHRKFLSIATEEKPPIVVLNVVVLEAEGLEAKDANGFSDPYCLLGIAPSPSAFTPQPPIIHSTSSSPGSRLVSRQASLELEPDGPGSPLVASPVAVLASTLGFSDPYCMLGIQPGGNNSSSGMGMSSGGSGSIHRDTPPGSPRTPLESSDSEERRGCGGGGGGGPGGGADSPHEKLRKHHSFRLSFKRREHGSGERERGGSERGRRGVEHRSDSTTSGYSSGQQSSSTPPYASSSSSAVPAKFIRATSVKAHTLNPRWNEKFRFDIDDVASDILHLDIWDHDDESSVLEAVSKLNEVRGVKGLGRFFKQIAQSARLGGGGGQDDFLGCVNIPLQDIPSTGLERWYELEARTCRSSVQGRIRLRLWLSTREDRGTSEEEDDHWAQSRRQATLTHILLSHQLRIHRGPPCEWGGEIPPVAQAILHQHAIQGDVSELQATAGRWLAMCRLSMAPASTPVRRAAPYVSLQDRPSRRVPHTGGRGSGSTLHAHNQQHGPGMASGRRSPKPRPRRGGSRRSGGGNGTRRRGRGGSHGRRRGTANSEVHRDSIDLRLALKSLQQLEKKWGNTDPLSREEEECLAESFNAFIDFGLKLVRRHRQNFNTRDRLALCRLDSLLRCLGFMSSMKAFWKVCPFNKEIRGEVIASLRKGTVEWYEEIRNKAQPHTVPLEGMVNLITYLIVDLQKGIDYYASMFESTNGIPYFGVVYKQLDKLIHADIGSKVAEACAQMRAGNDTQDDQHLSVQGGNVPMISAPGSQYSSFDIGTPIFELHLAMQEFVQFREHLASQERRALAVNNYHEWFEPALEKWLHVAKYKAMLRVRKACEQATPLNGTTTNGSDAPPHSTSAIDCVSCFHQIEEFWRQLSWPDPISAYSHLCSLVDIICSSAEYFSELTNQKLLDSGFYEEQGPYKFNVEMCMVANDLEMVLRCVATLRDNLVMAPVMAAVESAAASQQQHQHHQQYGGMSDMSMMNTTGPDYRGALYNPIEAMQCHLDGMLTRIIGRMGVQLRQPLEKATFHLAWSPESLPTREAMAPLFRLLRSSLSPLSAALLPPNFTRALLAAWDAILAQIRRQMESSASSGEKLPSFYNRLSEALAILAHYFSHGDDGRWDNEDGPTRAVGPPPPPLTQELLNTPAYSSTRQLLSYHISSTQQLIDLYHAERLRMQQQIMASGSVSSETERAEYGTLTVRAYFNHDSLCVEVLSARDIIPLDPNGFSDPFVIIELLPRVIFSHCSEQRTSVQKKTLNPLFDECFEFSVSLEQCRMEGSMLLFTVMDHDVLTANDFAGEAFLSLGDIPGVSSANATVDNFHGLKHTDLPLMHQKNKHHPILQILEMRHGEKMAQDFVKKQKPRITS